MDRHLRRLARQAAISGLWEDKLLYNEAAIMSGIIPPPDVEIKTFWTPHSILKSGYGGAPPDAIWMPEPGDLQQWFRRWYLPNNLGVAASYNADNPIPGMAPWPFNIPQEEHELEAIAFWWEDENRFSLGEYISRITLEEPVFVAWPKEGAPKLNFVGSATPRFLISDTDSLLEVLSIVTVGNFANKYNIWDSTEWDPDRFDED